MIFKREKNVRRYVGGDFKVWTSRIGIVHDIATCQNTDCVFSLENIDDRKKKDYLCRRHVQTTGHSVHREIGIVTHYDPKNNERS